MNSPWVWTPERSAPPSLRLLCLPYAGGGAGVFAPWAKLLPETIEVWAVRLPGRESRWKEPALTSMQTILAALASELAPHLPQTAYAVLGYSVGALLAFELLRELRRRGVPLPALFIPAARSAPQRPRLVSPVHLLPEREFLEAVGKRYQGIPKMVLEDRELLNLYLPPLRADMTVNETYRYTEEAPLPVPIAALGGLDDPSMAFDDLAAWRHQTSASFELEMFPGGHFFAQEQRPQFLAALRRRLTAIDL